MRKINTTEFINISLHVAEIFTLAMEINTLATRAESIHILCKTDFNNCRVATIKALIRLSPKALLFILKEKRKSWRSQRHGWVLISAITGPNSAPDAFYPPVSTFLLLCPTPQALLLHRPVGTAWLPLHSLLTGAWGTALLSPWPLCLCPL